MKKKLMMSVSALAVVALTAFTSYKTQNAQSTMANLMLDENIEALTAGESKPNFYRLFPCPHSSYTECLFSQNTQRPECWMPTYC